ncbi:Mitochondrial basic amino acids transporter [Zalerion maritima]|uniref:Mitochondrial basic amino acids transporter n=1 Tax=Zalerion maritima TaxID=339359 RepID=A0AAD5WVA9_9PEZI|nr:Mitochondrial basic amino acids transporter [Zalerion maritima]
MSADFWAGYISGAVGIVIGNPLDLLKVRLQASSSTAGSSTVSTARLPLTRHFTSAATLVAGTAAPVLGYGALNALLFVSYNRSEKWFAQLLSPSSSGAIPTPSLEDGPRFRPGENLTATWLAGAVGGLSTWVVSTPTELIKCRAQMAAPPGSPSLSSWGVAKQVVRNEGVKGLYFGGAVTALRDSIGYGFYFWSYELISRWASRSNTGPDADGTTSEAVKVLLCGGIAGIVTWASIFPLDVIKTRVQTQAFYPPPPILLSRPTGDRAALLPDRGDDRSRTSKRKGAWHTARETYRQEGLRTFFRGLGICSIRAFVVNAFQWAVYEWIMKELGQGRDRSVSAAAIDG